MHPPVSDDRWAAMRELSDGAPYTHMRMATVGELNPTTVRERSSRDGWRRVDRRRAVSLWATGDFVGAVAANAVAVVRAMPGASVAALCARLATEAGEPVTKDVLEAQDGEGASAADDAAQDATLPPDERLARIGELLTRQASRILAAAEASRGVLTKAQIEALSALIKLAEKFETLAAERAADKQTRSDDEIAGFLERIDDRIVELARGHAERLGRRERAE